MYRSVHTDISPREFPSIWTVANDSSPLLHYNSPSASDVSGLIYNDRVITAGKVCLVGCNRKEKNRKESQGVSFVEILMSRKSDSW